MSESDSSPTSLLNRSEIYPRHYQLRLFNIDIHNKQTYEGSVVIDIVVASTTQVVQLHAAGLTILSASLIQVPDDGELQLPRGMISAYTVTVDRLEPVNTFIYDHDAETVSINSSTTLTAGLARLRLRFRGNINHEPYGLYRRYTTPMVDGIRDGNDHDSQSPTISTQFDPRGARMVFPCFDEPQLTATFDIEIEVSHGSTVLGNTPVRSIDPIERSGERRNIVALHRSPITSTNLLSWTIAPESDIIVSDPRSQHQAWTS
ncbi:hypothetical protein MBLNU457_2011t1 [Dothideomycetes sp. NU457]